MNSETLPEIQLLNNLSHSDFNNAISLLFEPAPPLATALYAARPFSTYAQLLEEANAIIHTLSPEDKITVINAHPRIGESKAALSAMSYHEQGYTAKQEEYSAVMARLTELNKAYEKKYGFRFVIFVNGRSRKEIMPILEQRLNSGSREGEMETGLKDMINIGMDRLRKLTR